MVENVQNFTKACKQLGIKETIVFDPMDLCDRRNLMKVVVCIHTLADISNEMGFEPKMEKLDRSYSFARTASVIWIF